MCIGSKSKLQDWVPGEHYERDIYIIFTHVKYRSLYKLDPADTRPLAGTCTAYVAYRSVVLSPFCGETMVGSQKSLSLSIFPTFLAFSPFGCSKIWSTFLFASRTACLHTGPGWLASVSQSSPNKSRRARILQFAYIHTWSVRFVNHREGRSTSHSNHHKLCQILA